VLFRAIRGDILLDGEPGNEIRGERGDGRKFGGRGECRKEAFDEPQTLRGERGEFNLNGLSTGTVPAECKLEVEELNCCLYPCSPVAERFAAIFLTTGGGGDRDAFASDPSNDSPADHWRCITHAQPEVTATSVFPLPSNGER